MDARFPPRTPPGFSCIRNRSKDGAETCRQTLVFWPLQGASEREKSSISPLESVDLSKIKFATEKVWRPI